MSKVFKDEKIFNKFKRKYKFIFKDKNFISILKNHFNKNGSLAAFTLAFLENRLGDEKVLQSTRINTEEWIELFSLLYLGKDVKESFEEIRIDACMSLKDIKKYFYIFDNFIDKLWQYGSDVNWKINMSKDQFHKLLSSAFGYILYNNAECKLENKVSKIVKDKDYEKKYVMILNNTKLFAEAKQHILDTCEQKINDLIVILLGGSNHLALDK